MQTIRLIAKMPTLAAFAYRHTHGQPIRVSGQRPDLRGNFLNDDVQDDRAEVQAGPPARAALDILFILHADHEQNCCTNAVRSVGSSQVDPYSAVAAGMAALYGPLHGGANEAVLRMLRRIGSKDDVPAFIEGRQAQGRAPDGLRPPRLQELRPAGQDHQARRPTTSSRSPGKNPLLEIAIELERIALEDDYFV